MMPMTTTHSHRDRLLFGAIVTAAIVIAIVAIATPPTHSTKPQTSLTDNRTEVALSYVASVTTPSPACADAIHHFIHVYNTDTPLTDQGIAADNVHTTCWTTDGSSFRPGGTFDPYHPG